jgi:hypothetical protein
VHVQLLAALAAAEGVEAEDEGHVRQQLRVGVLKRAKEFGGQILLKVQVLPQLKFLRNNSKVEALPFQSSKYICACIF